MFKTFWRTLIEVVDSKKAMAALSGVMIALGARVGLDLPEDLVNHVIQIVMVYIISQAGVDITAKLKEGAADEPIPQ